MRILGSYSNIPLEVINVLKYTLPGLFANSASVGTYTQANIRRTIGLSGDPENISVLEDPAGYISVDFAGSTRKIPFFND